DLRSALHPVQRDRLAPRRRALESRPRHRRRAGDPPPLDRPARLFHIGGEHPLPPRHGETRVHLRPARRLRPPPNPRRPPAPPPRPLPAGLTLSQMIECPACKRSNPDTFEYCECGCAFYRRSTGKILGLA